MTCVGIIGPVKKHSPYSESVALHSVSDVLALFIASRKTPAVFQLSGGMIAFMIDAIARLGKTPIINMRHEQGVGFAAEGVARVKRSISFAFATSGPGATNLVTSIASSYFDSVPVVYITGQVHRRDLRKNPNQRQNGFQELEISEIVKPITKAVFRPQSPNEVVEALYNACSISLQNRMGPTLIDIPIDLQQIECEVEVAPINSQFDEQNHENFSLSKSDLAEVHNFFSKASNPLVLVGGGVRLDDAVGPLRQFLEQTRLPFVNSLLGTDAAPQELDGYLGFIGSYGNRWANYAISKSDLLLVLGSRLDVRQTGNNIQRFVQGKRFIRVDVDVFELNGRVSSDLAIQSRIGHFLESIDITPLIGKSRELINEVKDMKKSKPQQSEQGVSLPLNPNELIAWIGNAFSDTAGFIVDVGQHQMWAAQSILLKPNQRFITSGGLGAMGFAIPTAIGASVARPDKWVAIVGDGCMQLNLGELQTIIHYNLPIAICLINNGQHGMVAQFQMENMGGRLVGTRDGYSNPNYQNVAKAFKFDVVHQIRNHSDLSQLEPVIRNWTSGPLFLEFIIDERSRALPKLSVGE